jgi:membrane protein implicated in regulation of membrane protease activity
MCHLILLMPVVGLVVFWLLPLSVALPIYLVILILSGLLYYTLMRAMHRPVVTGVEGLVGKPVKVLKMSGHRGKIRFQGAIWQAVSDDILHKGDTAQVLGMDGLTIKIGKIAHLKSG